MKRHEFLKNSVRSLSARVLADRPPRVSYRMNPIFGLVRAFKAAIIRNIDAMRPVRGGGKKPPARRLESENAGFQRRKWPFTRD